jgi:hypothetical protein
MRRSCLADDTGQCMSNSFCEEAERTWRVERWRRVRPEGKC